MSAKRKPPTEDNRLIEAVDRASYCERCQLVVIAPATGRERVRLGPCPSCDMVAWADLNYHDTKTVHLTGEWE